MFNIDKKGKMATLMAFVLVLGIVGSFVFAAPKVCNNGIDDDNDGLVDYANDPGCSNSRDNTEISATLVCDNGLDEVNDADAVADFRLSNGDAGCTSVTDSNEVNAICDDTIDNLDTDNIADYPNDLGCSSYSDNDEIDGACDDTLDSLDRDNLIDYPSDLGCANYADNNEIDGMCDDSVDDASDLDVLADASDPGCSSFSDTSEIGQCEDSLDNDGDGFIDYLYLDSKCTSYGDDDESPRDFCNDNDGGINVNTIGIVTGDDESVSFSFSDTCIDTTYLTEYYCGWYSQDYMPLSTNRTCIVNGTTMCSSGRCV